MIKTMMTEHLFFGSDCVFYVIEVSEALLKASPNSNLDHYIEHKHVSCILAYYTKRNMAVYACFLAFPRAFVLVINFVAWAKPYSSDRPRYCSERRKLWAVIISNEH